MPRRWQMSVPMARQKTSPMMMTELCRAALHPSWHNVCVQSMNKLRTVDSHAAARPHAAAFGTRNAVEELSPQSMLKGVVRRMFPPAPLRHLLICSRLSARCSNVVRRRRSSSRRAQLRRRVQSGQREHLQPRPLQWGVVECACSTKQRVQTGCLNAGRASSARIKSAHPLQSRPLTRQCKPRSLHPTSLMQKASEQVPRGGAPRTGCCMTRRCICYARCVERFHDGRAAFSESIACHRQKQKDWQVGELVELGNGGPLHVLFEQMRYDLRDLHYCRRCTRSGCLLHGRFVIRLQRVRIAPICDRTASASAIGYKCASNHARQMTRYVID
mmetsp:Transcript_7881/g.17254  ORF Transcript_7881/g.17254 Transcript_7881/m.17254 type:complete len:330 (-) Transcript_7881:283-1272(-)